MTTPSVTETHVSTLFFTSDRVYKLLKPVKTGFLDHTDPQSRVVAAQLEVDLNRRLSPDVYLGVADVMENGTLADRMIVMRRLPAECSMTAIILSGRLQDGHIRSVAKKVAAFHAGLEPIVDTGGPGSLSAQQRNWQESFDEIEPFLESVLDRDTQLRIEELTSRYLEGQVELFAARVLGGFVRDGHGDLLADDIFLTNEGPRILDCLAFDPRLRIGDVLSDIAFLAMDLHRLSGPRAARALIDYYCEFSGEVHPASLAHHYVAYRAFVRCKVACLRFEQGAPEFAAVARMYHRLALDQLERARKRIVIVGGGPGTGKTSVANRIGDHFSWPVVSSDIVRKELASVEPGTHSVAQPDEGLYTPTITENTYAEMLRRAELLLNSGQSVVIDASWTREEHRALVRGLAQDTCAELIELECRVDASIAKERVARRLADSWDPSDATPEIVDHMRRIRDPWPLANQLDTTKQIDETMETVFPILLDAATTAASSPALDFWGNYHKYTEIARSRPFHTVI